MNFRKLKIGYLFTNKKPVPKINISGKWVQEAGFQIGEDVKITVAKNQIIITNKI